eukprot:381389-Rhodomonas_salina.1
MDSKSSLAYKVSICNLEGAQSRSENLASLNSTAPILCPLPTCIPMTAATSALMEITGRK